MKPIGLGNPHANLIVFIANRPPLDEFNELTFIREIRHNEIKQIADLTGNHWRKIFNCFAKLAFGLDNQSETSWQALRDKQLLTSNSAQLLLFSPPDLSKHDSNAIKIICGKTYFNQLNLLISVEWIDDYFAINRQEKLIVSPYFDYRQLSNLRISQLVKLISSLQS